MSRSFSFSSVLIWLMHIGIFNVFCERIPLAKMQQAQVLLEHWDDWAKAFRFSWIAPSPPEKSKEGSNCSATAQETLGLMYYLRIRDSSLVFHTTEQRKKDQKDFFWLRHVASHLEFYKAKLGSYTLPALSHDYFCLPPPPNMHYPVPGKKLGFNWPPDPYYLICDPEQKKCMSCEEVAVSDVLLREVCNLEEPVMDPIDTPIRSQRLFAMMKDSVSGFNPQTYVGVEGGSCDARPVHSFWLNLMKDFIEINNSTVPDYPRTLEEYKSEWRAITRLEEDYENYSKMFHEAKKNVLWDRIYCDPNKGLVCGGKSCKLCTEEIAGSKFGWTYEQGLLHKACKMITNSGDVEETAKKFRRESNGNCPSVQCPLVEPECPPTDETIVGRKGSDGGIDFDGSDELLIYRRTHKFKRGRSKKSAATAIHPLVDGNGLSASILITYVLSRVIICDKI